MGKKTLKAFKIVALDSNIFIYQFERHPQFGPVTKEKIFHLLVTQRLKAITSIITLIELLSIKASEEQIQNLKDLYFDTPNLSTADVSLEIATEAAKIRRKYGYRLPDSIQLATALFSKVRVFVTNDERLKKFPELQVICLEDIS